MKKKTLCLFVVVFIVANMFFSTTPTTGKESQLTLVLLEARADEPVESDLPEPGNDPVPTRLFPSEWTLSGIIDYFF